MESDLAFARVDHFESIHRLWGKNRSMLGLMPKGAFLDAIKKNWILIKLIDGNVVGYLKFRYTERNQTLSIVHLCIDARFRKNGYAVDLLDKLVKEFSFKARGIRLNCRSDYTQAIVFWTRYNFQPRNSFPSRGSNPAISLIVWWYNFGHEDLFTTQKSTKIEAILDFNIIAKLRDEDFNSEKTDEVAQLKSDWLVTEIEYYKTSETTSEIFRDTNLERRHRSELFLQNLPELNISKIKIKEKEEELRLIFPGKSENDRSDRLQVAEAVLSGYPYFVTLDKGILSKKNYIESKYQLKIVTPSVLISEIDFSVNHDNYYPSKLSGEGYYSCKVKPGEIDELAGTFLKYGKGEKIADFDHLIGDLLSNSSGNILLVKENVKFAALVGWYEVVNRIIVPVIRTVSSPLRRTIFYQNINDILKLCLAKEKEFVTITDLFLVEDEKEALVSLGFFKKEIGYCRGVKRGIFKATCIENALKTITDEIPDLLNLILSVSAKNRSYLNVIALEKFLWPLKIVEMEVPCFIIPIKPFYAKALFDSREVISELFGVEASLIWSKENIYYRSARQNVEIVPARILWYVSENKNYNRQKAIVCSSYLDEIIIGKAKEVFNRYKKFGVYNWDRDISKLTKQNSTKEIKVLQFSDSESFPKPIPLSKIKAVLKSQNESDNNFQSPLRITTATFMLLYSMGNNLSINA